MKGRVKNRCIIVADDIMTTGATLAACAEALYDKGAAEVYGATIVRTIRRPRSGLVVLGSRQVRVQWTELDQHGRTKNSAGPTVIWVRFGCSKRCPHILTAGPFPTPGIGTESLHDWQCECRTNHTIALSGDRGSVEIHVDARQPSELLVALRHYRP